MSGLLGEHEAKFEQGIKQLKKYGKNMYLLIPIKGLVT